MLDLALCCKSTNRFSNISFDSLTAFAPHNTRCEHCFQLGSETCSLSSALHSFNNRVVPVWNIIPENVVGARNLSVFMHHLKHFNVRSTLRTVCCRFVSDVLDIRRSYMKRCQVFWSATLRYTLERRLSDYALLCCPRIPPLRCSLLSCFMNRDSFLPSIRWPFLEFQLRFLHFRHKEQQWSE